MSHSKEKELRCLESKLISMLGDVHTDIKALEIEWLHMKGLVDKESNRQEAQDDRNETDPQTKDAPQSTETLDNRENINDYVFSSSVLNITESMQTVNSDAMDEDEDTQYIFI